MGELNLPPLSLFGRSHTTKQHLHSKQPRDNVSLFEVLKQSNRIQNQVYTPYIPFPMATSEKEYSDIKNIVQLQYLNTYYKTLNKQSLQSYHTTQRIHSTRLDPPQSRPKLQNCLCQESVNMQKERSLIKNPYLNSYNLVKNDKQIGKQLKKESLPSKQAYLNSKRLQEQPHVGQVSFINHITNSIFENHQPAGNNSKIINNNSNILNNHLNTNQSVIVDIQRPQQKKLVASEEVQTEELPNRSSFVIEKHRNNTKMDSENYQRTLRSLTTRINNLNLDISSDDLVIDLSDLVLTKDQYLEQSNSILSALQNLAQGRAETRQPKGKRASDRIIWPDV